MSIRTTVTLDDDVVERLKEEARAKGLPFRKVINEVLRFGLIAAQATSKIPPFKVEPRSMGLMPGLSYDNIEALLEIGEGENHK